jgi:hypothetical protein
MIIAQSSACGMARIAGAFYLLTIMASLEAYFGPRNTLTFISGLVDKTAFIVVTVLLYFLFKPVSRNLSLVTACFGMAGSAVGVLNSLHLMPFKINILDFFAFFCLLIGYLILRSTFLPPFLGILMILGGAGYLTCLWPPLAKSLYPFNILPGVFGECALTLWLLVKGVNGKRWEAQARKAEVPAAQPGSDV